MSWLARSISDSLRLDDDDDRRHLENDTVSTSPSSIVTDSQSQLQQQGGGGEREHSDDDDLQSSRAISMRGDLTEFKETLTKQIWGVASFLAPPISPPLPPPNRFNKLNCDLERSVTSVSNSAEIGVGSESEIEEEEEENYGNDANGKTEEEEENYGNDAVGITEEVLAFAMNIAMHPETWLDFPLDPDEDLDDFEMSRGQHEHAFAVTQLSPQLNALRIELYPCHMSESYFWKVYFVLLHSRLAKQDSEILSTPQVMEARAMWMQELQKQTKPETDWLGRSISYLKDNANDLHEDFYPRSNYACSESFSPRIYAFEPTTSSMTADYDNEKRLAESTEVHFVDKSVIEERPLTKTEERDIYVLPCSKISVPIFEDDDDDNWPEEDSDLEGYSGNIVCNAEDFSFSDLEVDDDDDVRFHIAKSRTLANET